MVLASCAGLARAEDARWVRNGMPCVEDVCVGDDARELLDLPWDPAVHPSSGVPLAKSRVSQASFTRLARSLRADEKDLRAVAPYWLIKSVDGSGLRALLTLRAVCEGVTVSSRLRGSYTGPDGAKTVVRFEPVAPRPGASPRFVVASIRRYLTLDADATVPDVGRATAERYKPLPAVASPNAPAAAWVTASPRGPHLLLLASYGDPRQREEDLRRHPACGRSEGVPDLATSEPEPSRRGSR